MNFIRRTLQIADKHVAPQYSITAMLQRSLIQEAIEENKAQLESMRIGENAMLAELLAALTCLKYSVDRTKSAVESGTREFNYTVIIDQADQVKRSADAVAYACREIAAKVSGIQDMQGELADAELWQGVQ